MSDDSVELAREELDQGWHFCPDWDGLLIGPGMGEVAARVEREGLKYDS